MMEETNVRVPAGHEFLFVHTGPRVCVNLKCVCVCVPLGITGTL